MPAADGKHVIFGTWNPRSGLMSVGEWVRLWHYKVYDIPGMSEYGGHETIPLTLLHTKKSQRQVINFVILQ